jgi:hypothetical protein
MHELGRMLEDMPQPENNWVVVVIDDKGLPLVLGMFDSALTADQYVPELSGSIMGQGKIFICPIMAARPIT